MGFGFVAEHARRMGTLVRQLALASTSRKGKLLGNDDTDSHETASRFLIQVNVLACKKHVSDASYEART